MEDSNLLCRICLADGEIPIFGDEDDSCISEEISVFGDIQISENDDFPKHICRGCFQLLLGAMMFRNAAKNSDKWLKNSLFSVSEDTIDSYPPSHLSEHNSDTNEGGVDNGSDSDVSRSVDDGFSPVEESEVNDSEAIIVIVGNESTSDNLKVSRLGTSQSPAVYQEDLELFENEQSSSKLELINDQLNKTSCSICGVMVLEDDYNQHTQNHYADDDKTTSITECTTCSLQLDTMEDFEEHCNSDQHKNAANKLNSHQQKVKCTVCDKFVNKYYFKTHLLIHGGKEDRQKLLAQCPYCGKSVFYSYFNDHIQRIHKDKAGLNHVPRKTNKSEHPQFICDKCGKTFKQKPNLQQHILIHGAELTHKCNFCPYRGLHAGLLKIHVRTHTKDYNYKCPNCPAKFLTKSNLMKHQRKHNPGSGKFSCELCEKRYYSKPDLERHHEAVHLGIKEHICNICNKAFSCRGYMLCHQLKVHKRKRFTDGNGRLPNYLTKEFKNETQN